MDLYGFTWVYVDLEEISVIYGLRGWAACGNLWQPLAIKSPKLWPLYNSMLSPGLDGGLAGRMVAGWLDGWMAGWLDNSMAGWLGGPTAGWLDHGWLDVCITAVS